MKALLAGLSLILGACDSATDPTKSVRLTLAAPDLRVGDKLRASLYNGSEDDLTFGACDQRRQKLVGGAWETIHPESNVCIAILIVVRPGLAHNTESQLTSPADTGTFRLLQFYWINEQGPARTAVSAPFVVRPAGT